MSSIDFFIDILQKQPPYKEIPITKDDLTALIQYDEAVRVDNYCQDCDTKRTFISYNMREFVRDLDSLREHEESEVATPKGKNVIFSGLELSCIHCKEGHYFPLRISAESITKVGQYPSFSREMSRDVRKYKKLISKYYTELTASINLHSMGASIGAFVYLRRILEYLVETKFNALPEKPDKAKFVDKMKAVQKVETIIPPELDDIKDHIYSLLSKGVHEYSEEECASLYDVAFLVVTEILDQELHNKERKAKIDEARKKIVSKLKG